MFRLRMSRAHSHVLPEHASCYYNNVVAEYRAMTPGQDPATLALREAADGIIKKYPDVTWSDLYALESLVMQLQPEERLRRRACILREKYRMLVGDEAYQKYLKCSAVDAATAKLADLRAELAQLLSEFHWLYSAVKTREILYGDLQRGLLKPVFLYVLFVFGWGLYELGTGGTVPTLMVVILMGVVGAYTSIVRRVQMAQAQPPSPTDDPVVRFSQLGFGQFGVFFALATGGIFSVVLYLLFIGGFLEGTIFPEIDTPDTGKALSFRDFAIKTDPKGGIEYGKLLVWSFLSGFAERLVPDVLDRVTSRGAQAAGGQAPRGGANVVVLPGGAAGGDAGSAAGPAAGAPAAPAGAPAAAKPPAPPAPPARPK